MKKQWLLLFALVASGTHIQVVRSAEMVEAEDTCLACCGPLGNGAPVATAPCGHVFHQRCLANMTSCNNCGARLAGAASAVHAHRPAPVAQARPFMAAVPVAQARPFMAAVPVAPRVVFGNQQMTDNLFEAVLKNASNGILITELLARGAQVTCGVGITVLQNFFAGIIKSGASPLDLAASSILLFQAGANPFDRTIKLYGKRDRVSFFRALQEEYKQAVYDQDAQGIEKYAQLMEITAVWALQNNPTPEAIEHIGEMMLDELFMQAPEGMSFMRAVTF